MASRLLAVSFDVRDPDTSVEFWGGLLGRDAIDDQRGLLLAGSDTQLGLRFVPSVAEKVGPDRLHLHLISTGPDGQHEMVATALALGAQHLEVGQLPEERHIVLADPEGTAFCVIESGNAYLAGCGLLGEIACDGTRQVGLFWAEALGWPLVWDVDQETAVQSPHGGTKVAWGGSPVAPKQGRNRQRFDLAVTDGTLAAEVDRLIALGATRLDGGSGDPAGADSIELADPNGNEFRLTPG